jgi:hypothetical protein
MAKSASACRRLFVNQIGAVYRRPSVTGRTSWRWCRSLGKTTSSPRDGRMTNDEPLPFKDDLTALEIVVQVIDR